MQTFLPYPDFNLSAKCLDYKRLGKQRIEAFQLLVVNKYPWVLNERIKRGLTNDYVAWHNHPAAIIWRGYEDALSLYMDAMIKEWTGRGYNNTMALRNFIGVSKMPPWMGDEKFHSSHRANLLRKDENFYRKFLWNEPTDLPYVWPITKD